MRIFEIQVNEQPDDDVLPTPNRADIEKRKIAHRIKMGKVPSWFAYIEGNPFTDNEFDLTIKGPWLLPDNHTVISIFCGPLTLEEDDIDMSSVSATVENPYDDEDHPYGNDMVADEITNILHSAGFPNDIWVSWSENGMQDLDYLHFDSNLGDYIINFVKSLKT